MLSATDPWVAQYEKIAERLKKFGVPKDRLDDYDWIRIHLPLLITKENREDFPALRDDLLKLHGY